jgi:hypothetical protein
MVRNFTMQRRSAKEHPADMYDDKTASHTTSYNISYIPIPSLAAVFLALLSV